MRFVVTDQLRPGMRLARPLYRKSDIMLSTGITLTQQYISSIRRCGFPGVYIADSLSEDIEVPTLISHELHSATVTRLQEVFHVVQNADTLSPIIPDITSQVESVVAELCNNKEIMINIMELSSYDSYTYSHSMNVMILSILLGSSLKLSQADLVGLGTGALLHDIGKVYVDKDIIQKAGPLTPEEFQMVKPHPKTGYNYVTQMNLLSQEYALTVLDHHERFDGEGYPNGKKGEEISLYGRICAVSDVYDALTSKRPYRTALPSYEGVEYVMAASNTLFDPNVVVAFTERIAPYPVGTSVILSNGWVGLVVENYLSYSLRPKLRIYQQDGQAIAPFEISLRDDMNYLNVTVMGIV